MADKHLLSVLENLGLGVKEACLYCAALKLGPSSILELARASGIKRSTLYSVVESLKEKRLMRREVRGIKDVYAAESPEHLRGLIEQRREALLDVLPQLSALHKLEGGESVIKFYQGVDGTKMVYLDLLSSVRIGEDYLVLSDLDIWQELGKDFFLDFTRKRGKMDIKVRMILTDSALARERKGPKRQPNERTRLLKAGTKLTTNLVIIPRKVFIHQLVAPVMGVIIENPHIIRMHREMFELIWSGLRD